MRADNKPPPQIVVATLYKFVPLADPGALKDKLLGQCAGLKGTVLLAGEGVNATVAGSRRAVDRLLACLRAIPGFDPLEIKESVAPEQPFYRMKISLKKEIVTLGLPDIDAAGGAGEYVEPSAWNALIGDPRVTLIDARNRYEVHLGRFPRGLDPQTDSFRDFPAWADAHLNPEKNRKVAMYCTGGIRCEKASAYLLQRGFAEVYHLHGGILNYLKEVPVSESLWQGECFVFDNRVTVDHELEPGNHEICFNCRMPLTADDLASADYQPDISCPHCRQRLTPARRRSLKERSRQVALARARGQHHIGQQFPKPGTGES